MHPSGEDLFGIPYNYGRVNRLYLWTGGFRHEREAPDAVASLQAGIERIVTKQGESDAGC